MADIISLDTDLELLKQLLRPTNRHVPRGPGDPEPLDLSVRSGNCLWNSEINFVFQLVQKSERDLLTTKNFGGKSLREIREVLFDIRLSLDTRIKPDVLERLERFAAGQIKAEFVFSDKVMPGLARLTEAVELVAGRHEEVAELLAWPGTQLVLERPELARSVLDNLELLRFAASLQKLGKF